MADGPFRCPHCGERSRGNVINSRAMPEWIYRRRRCGHCGERFSTREESFYYLETDDLEGTSR